MPDDSHDRSAPGDDADVRGLTRRMVAGDDAAYREFHAAYFGRLFRYLVVLTRGDETAARDALQETMRRVVRHIRVFDAEIVFWSWLTVLARSARADQGRQRQRYFSFLERFRRDAEVAAAPPASDDHRLDELLTQEVAGLGPGDRELLRWKYTERACTREIAERLGASEKAVESRLARLRTQLREKLLNRLRDET